MMGQLINFGRVQRALAQLDRIAIEHPELVSTRIIDVNDWIHELENIMQKKQSKQPLRSITVRLAAKDTERLEELTKRLGLGPRAVIARKAILLGIEVLAEKFDVKLAAQNNNH